ncbi:MAG TPA: hypothetical protein VFE78_24105, partial [Gemmataceae bacterium]|nr:hypothetical protein [Gemmataceae bacterium]
MTRDRINRRQALRLVGFGGALLLSGCPSRNAGPSLKTLKPGVLQVASAFPDPPFEVQSKAEDIGFDAELMQHICQ